VFELDSNFKWIQLISKCCKIERSKRDLPWLKKFEIKYGFESSEGRNKFLHRNFFRFEMELEWKFKESLGFEFG
jgi:hypothetical protein